MKKLIYFLFAGTFAFSACGGDDDPARIEVAGVTLSKTALTLRPGQSETLTARITPAEAEDKSIVWKSSDEQVATVADGVVTAVKPGSAVVTAMNVGGGEIGLV